MTTRRPFVRFPLMALAMLALLSALWGGVERVGWQLPEIRPVLFALHGPLMISGFLGTLIGIERAVAIGPPWAYAGPLLTGLGSVALIAGSPHALGAAMITAGSAVLVVVSGIAIRRQPALFTFTMGLGALCWLAGNALWLAGTAVSEVVSWWAAFLLLTIAGERLELSRLVRVSRASQAVFIVIVGGLIAGALLGGVSSNAGARVIGVDLLGLSLWLLRHDVARRTVRGLGLPRFTAVCLLSGYVWLAVSGLLALRFGGVIAGASYDAVLHSVFLGFIFAMIFGHAPIIFPAVLGLAVPFRSAFYAHLALLHLSLLLRVLGDLAASVPARRWGGLLNAATIVFFLANTAWSVRLGRRPPLAQRGAAPDSSPSATSGAGAKAMSV